MNLNAEVVDVDEYVEKHQDNVEGEELVVEEDDGAKQDEDGYYFLGDHLRGHGLVNFEQSQKDADDQE